MPRIAKCLLLIACLPGLPGCGGPSPVPVTPSSPVTAMDPVILGDYPGLRHVIRVTPQLLSGAAPEGDSGFRSLHDLGVTLIVSVDGAEPEINRLANYPMRYAHLPLGYDGIPGEKAFQIARLLEAEEGKGIVYVHCHHGKHRGPAAVAAALRCRDPRITPELARDFLKLAGTDPKYAGLYRDAMTMQVNDTRFAVTIPPAVARVSSLVKAMVAMDRQWDRIREIRASNWGAPSDHADWQPAHEALMLREIYREAIRSPDLSGHPKGVLERLEQGERLSGEVEDELRINPNPARRESLFRQLAENCFGCHETFRDRPK